ncbi:hypothetical protein HJC23_011282 [Cyclotella cryptica]|uniref:DUF6824 domain-containing protein n=1 Tax=Cyclotella cryptica TaxID=29204 RepID=A0ABD3QVA8_9STRA|eukprot:CCRYP_001665-RA/>CCRYP_001665-RA protein AED:0.00 eAED:0.00 QI:109/-1/1/1/-1/1/1/868/463
MSKPPATEVNKDRSSRKYNSTQTISSKLDQENPDRSPPIKTTPTPTSNSNLSAAEYIYSSMRDTQSKSSAHQMMIQARPALRKKEGSNTSIKGRSGLEKTCSSNSMRSGLEKIGSNRSIMSGVLSMDMFPEDLDSHGGLFSLQADSKRSINSSEFVMNEFLSDGGLQLSIGPDMSNAQIFKSGDLPLLTAKFERITTGDDIMEENIRLSSSDWGRDFQDDTAVIGPMPQSMFYDSSSSMPAAATTVLQAVPATFPARTRHDENTPYSSALSPVSSVDGAQIKPTPSLPPLSPTVDNGADNVLSGSLTDKNSSHLKTKKRRKRVIADTACVPTDDDVLFGRGGYTNNRPGNIFFRQEALRLRPWYEQSSKEEKYEISNILLESVKSRGGRFLEKGGDGLWHEVIGNGARRKASQALRERIKGRGASVLSSSITSARSQDSSADERDETGADPSLGHTDVDLVEV